MLEGHNELEIDILNCLRLSLDMRLQRRDLKGKLAEKYVDKKYDIDTFDVTLQRKLNHLCVERLLEKDVKGHQQVYYHIPEGKQNEVEHEVLTIMQMKREKTLLDSMSLKDLRELNNIISNQREQIRSLEEDHWLYEETVAELEDWSPIEKHLVQVGPAPLGKEEGEKLTRAQEEWKKRQIGKNVPNCRACGKLMKGCKGATPVMSWVCPEGRGSNGEIQNSATHS